MSGVSQERVIRVMAELSCEFAQSVPRPHVTLATTVATARVHRMAPVAATAQPHRGTGVTTGDKWPHLLTPACGQR